MVGAIHVEHPAECGESPLRLPQRFSCCIGNWNSPSEKPQHLPIPRNRKYTRKTFPPGSLVGQAWRSLLDKSCFLYSGFGSRRLQSARGRVAHSLLWDSCARRLSCRKRQFHNNSCGDADGSSVIEKSGMRAGRRGILPGPSPGLRTDAPFTVGNREMRPRP